MKFFLTGHTGFKGAWLSLALTDQGHDVHGYALDPEPGALFEVANIAGFLERDYRNDIRDAKAVRQAMAEVAPDVVIHMAAQPLVRESYSDPRYTIETNVMGTLAVLEAVRDTPSVAASVMITTDKVYRNVNQRAGYVESDALGGHDPYSASKAMSDLLIQSWVASFSEVPTAVARAGNVIGGGDVCKDRLMPDLIRGYESGAPVEIRYPQAVRPWQHVLDCIQGYIDLSHALLTGTVSGGEWNFGPREDSFRTVSEIADLTSSLWGSGTSWFSSHRDHLHEADILALDATKARIQLGWDDRLSYSQAVSWTVSWHKRVSNGEDPREVTLAQIEEYLLHDAH